MKGFLEQYGTGIFVLVLMSIFIAFASPIGNTIKNAVNAQIKNVENVENETIASTKTYTIVFDGNGATSGSMEPMEVVCGKEITLPECTFKASDKPFVSWNISPNGQSTMYENQATVKDLTSQGYSPF